MFSRIALTTASFAILQAGFVNADVPVTIFNNCPIPVSPKFLGTNNGLANPDTLAPGASTAAINFNDGFSGYIYDDSSPGSLRAVLNLSSGYYYLLAESGVGTPMSITANAPQREGYCGAAVCTSPYCVNGYFSSIPTLPVGATTRPSPPLYQCPFVGKTFTITFCPGNTTPPPTTTTPAPPAESTPPSTNYIAIHPNGNPSVCLDVAGNVQADGTPVQAYECNGSGAQKWIINRANTKVQLAGTNFCLDAGTTPGNGIQMKIWTCYNGLPAQAFYWTGDNRIAVTDKGQCLDLTDGRLSNGNTLQTWECSTGNTNQIWTA